ncbi:MULTISPECIES: hypothetical protein [Brevibacillus]|nr:MULTISPECIES: hypothetical protein [Brevibacillus]
MKKKILMSLLMLTLCATPFLYVNEQGNNQLTTASIQVNVLDPGH